MLIICSGADSYRSLEKARSLESAYRDKYDKDGRSVERVPFGKDGTDVLLSIASGASLFSERRFIRADNLIKTCPKSKREALVKTLSRDAELTIVVSLEAGEPNKKDLNDFKNVPKFFQYDFPLLSPPQFASWARAFAEKNDLTDASRIQDLISVSQGDSWLFVNEFNKIRAGGHTSGNASGAMNIFEVVDAFLQRRSDRWSALRRFDDAQSVMSQTGNQVRALGLVLSGHAKGVHPFVAQKLRRMKNADPHERFTHLMTAFTWSRTGMADVNESFDILG
jgi:hypothetical protein